MIVERNNIGFFGKMNSGKSSTMNLLTEQEISIVDSKPGTTADTQITLKEIDGLGPVKLYDTAGADEFTSLGQKKRQKVFSTLKECDLALIVIDPSTKDFDSETEIIKRAHRQNKQLLVIFNLFKDTDRNNIQQIESMVPLLSLYPYIIINAINISYKQPLLNFIINNFESKHQKIELLPFVEEHEYYILNVIMGVESTSGKSIRPQAMVEEYITRKWAYPVSFRMDSRKIKGREMASEKERFIDFMHNFKKKPKAIITDSQTVDIIRQCVLGDIMLTTFPVTMLNFISKGNLYEFVKNLRSIDRLQMGEKVLIVEASKRSRIGDEVRAVDISDHFKEKCPGVIVEHNFGNEFQENDQIKDYKLIIHRGGHMVSSRKILARIRGISDQGIPYTDYGLLLMYIQGIDTIKLVLKPWGLDHLVG